MSVSDERLAKRIDNLEADLAKNLTAHERKMREEGLALLRELQSLRAAAKVRAIREGDGEWVRTAVQQYLAQMKAAHAGTETGPGYINSGSYFSTLDNLPDFVAAASPIPTTGGEPTE